jgi:AraC-like DNA-binding protein
MRKTASRRETPAAFVRAILLAYASRGLDPGPALRHAGLRPGEFGDDPGAKVAVESFESLSAFAMREFDDEALGWFGRRLPWGSYGMLLRASLTAPTLGVALRRWCRHHGLLTEDVRILPQVEDGVCVVRIEERSNLGALREFCLVSLLRNLHGVSCWLVDSRIPLAGTRFPFPAPAHAEVYGRLFPGTAAFDAPEAALRFDAGYLGLPVVRDDAALRQLLQRPIPLMARQYRQDRLLSRRILQLLSADAGGPADAPAIAARLNVSLRSLQRNLQEEGTSLYALKATARRTRAEALLRRSDLPLKRVARLVGYGDEASFGRAFRNWTGRTPADYRRNALRSALDADPHVAGQPPSH